MARTNTNTGGGGGGTVTGTGAATQIAYWDSATSITGNNALWWDAISGRLGVNTNTPGYAADINGIINTSAEYYINGLFFADQSQGTLSVSVGNNTHNVALGSRNTIFGNDAANNLTIGNDNTIIGQNAAGDAAWASNQNTAVGSQAGRLLSSGTRNVFMGYRAGDAIGAGNDNVLIGNAAGLLSASASGNVAVGSFALTSMVNAGAGNNTAVGANSLQLTTAQNNTALGAAAGSVNTGGQQNTFVGSLSNTVTGNGNDQTAFGYLASVDNRGTAIGSSTTAGDSGIALGHTATAAPAEFALAGSITNFKFQNDSYVLPVNGSIGTAGALTNDGAGNLTWAPAGGGTVTGTGALGQATFWTAASTISGSGDFLWNNTTKEFSVGDITSTGNDVTFNVFDPTNRIVGRTPEFTIENAGGQEYLNVNPGTESVEMGDISNANNSTKLTVDDAGQTVNAHVIPAIAQANEMNISTAGVAIAHTNAGGSWGFQGSAAGGGQAHILGGLLDWTWPAADSVGTQALTSNGAGALGWTTMPTGTLTGSGASPRIAIWSGASTLTSDAEFTFLANRGVYLEDNTATHNTFFGADAGAASISGLSNVAVGYRVGNALSSGDNNVMIGNGSGNLISTANGNVTIGNSAGSTLVSGDNNTIIGNLAAVGASSTTNAIALGNGASAITNQFALPDTIATWKFQGDTYTLPTTLPGSSGDVLSSTVGGVMTWITPTSGTVTSVDASGGTTGMTFSGGPIVGAGTLTMAGTLAIANGGTGQTTAANAINALLPSQGGNSGEFLTTNGSVASWAPIVPGASALSVIGAAPNANGATLTGVTLNLEPASASFGGVVTTGAQTLAGAKTFSSAAIFSAASSITLGTASSATGAALLKNATNANTLTVQSGVTSASYAITLPTAVATANDQALVSTTGGVTSWGPVIDSGFYTPTLFNDTNISASTVYDATWMRIGNVVTVGGRVEVDPTGATANTELGISLPIASNIAGLEGVCGTANCPTVISQSAAIQGDAANNRATMRWVSGDTTNQSMYYTYQYYIV